MIQLSLTIADIGENQTIYTLQYGKIQEEFTITGDDLQNLSVVERQNAILVMLHRMFVQERENWLNTRPRHTPEGEMLEDLFEAMDEWLNKEDDDETDEEQD